MGYEEATRFAASQSCLFCGSGSGWSASQRRKRGVFFFNRVIDIFRSICCRVHRRLLGGKMCFRTLALCLIGIFFCLLFIGRSQQSRRFNFVSLNGWYLPNHLPDSVPDFGYIRQLWDLSRRNRPDLMRNVSHKSLKSIKICLPRGDTISRIKNHCLFLVCRQRSWAL